MKKLVILLLLGLAIDCFGEEREELLDDNDRDESDLDEFSDDDEDAMEDSAVTAENDEQAEPSSDEDASEVDDKKRVPVPCKTKRCRCRRLCRKAKKCRRRRCVFRFLFKCSRPQLRVCFKGCNRKFPGKMNWRKRRACKRACIKKYCKAIKG